jgi:uncharacterized membrane protein YfcA
VLSWVFLGGVVGMLLGLTGAGGSIIALPLLQFLMGMSVHEASVAVLPIVGVAALLSVFPQRRHVHLRLAAVVLGVSMPVTYAMAWAKPFVPESVITGLVLLFIGWAFVQTWRRSDARVVALPLSIGISGGVVGAVAGALTTLTGLGGGILLTPLLARLTRLSAAETTATAILVIAGNAFLSFVIQGAPTGVLRLSSFGVMVLGVLGANVGVMLLTRACPAVYVQRLQKWIYVGVLFLAALLLLIAG